MVPFKVVWYQTVTNNVLLLHHKINNFKDIRPVQTFSLNISSSKNWQCKIVVAKFSATGIKQAYFVCHDLFMVYTRTLTYSNYQESISH